MKKLFFFLFLTVAGFQIQAQQYPLVTQYMYNKMLYNPAYAGVNEEFTATALNRTQWIGTAGAPSTTLLMADVPYSEKIGIGGVLFYDKLGASDKLDLSANVSYSISSFSVGLKAGFSYYTRDPGGVSIKDPGDPSFSGERRAGILPRFGFGAYYDNLDFYAGITIPDLVLFDPGDVFGEDSTGTKILPRNFILTGGFNYFINDRITLIPSAMVKVYPSEPVLVDINLNAKILEKFLAGVGYRLTNAATLMVQVPFLDKFKAGYAFEWYFGNLSLPSGGTHELMISYGFRTF